MAGTLRRAALASVAVGALAAVVPLSISDAADEPAASCVILQVQNVRPGAPSRLSTVELPSGIVKPLADIGFWVNALGYSAAQDLTYGVADGDRRGRFPDGAHAVTIDRSGQAVDLGPVSSAGARHTPWSVVTGATAGTVDGNRWYVGKGSLLYTVDIDPADATFGKAVKVTPLRPAGLAAGVDDFAFDPADGLLYGVSTSAMGRGAVVTIDPATGVVRTVAGLKVPAESSYGSVVLGPDGALYVTANDLKGHSELMRAARDGSGAVTTIASGPPLVSSDSAGCLAAPAPPPPPPTTPPPTTSESPPPPPPSTSDSPTPSTPEPPPSGRAEPPPLPTERSPSPLAPAPVPPPPASTPAPEPQPPPPPAPLPSPSHPNPIPKPTRIPITRDQHVAQKRRWSLTVLLLILGGGAAAHRIRRNR